MTDDVDVAVVGGGLGGLTLAAALLQRSVQVDVFEQSAALREVGAGVALGGNAIRLLQRLGVDLGPVANVPPTLEFRRWADGGRLWSHPIGDWYAQEFGAPFYTLHRATLRQALAGCVPADRVHLGRRLVALTPERTGVLLKFAGTGDVRARVVVGADGVHSVTRSYVAAETRPKYSGEIGFRGVIRAAAARSLPRPASLHIWCGPGTHVVFYGLDEEDLAAIAALT